MKRATLGIRMHSGWGILVAVTDGAEVIDRRHITVIGDGMPGGKQPYHHAEELGLAEAEKYLAAYISECNCLAREEMKAVISAFKTRGYRIATAALVLAAGRTLPALPQILAAHPLIHTAEGELFRQTVRQGCESLSIPVMGYRERDLEGHAKKSLANSASKVLRQLAAAGKTMG